MHVNTGNTFTFDGNMKVYPITRCYYPFFDEEFREMLPGKKQFSGIGYERKFFCVERQKSPGVDQGLYPVDLINNFRHFSGDAFLK
jgi:hypothetical protein